MEGTGNSSVFCVAEEGIIDPDINNSQLQLSPNELTALTEECEMQGSHSPLRNSILVAEVHSQNATAQSPEPGIPHSTPASEGSEFHTNQTADGPVGTSSASYNPATLSLTSLPTLVTEDVIIPSSSIFCDAPHGSSAGQVAQHSREDENVLKYFIILRPTGPAATVLAKVCMCLYCETQQSVKDYCFTNLGFNNNQYKRVFTAQERSALEANISWEVFDITFLYKLLQRVCGLAPPSDKRWAEPDPQYSDELEHCLYLIKGERNFLAHEAVTLSDSELRNRSHHMKTLLEKVLLKTGLKKSIDYSQDVINMKSEIDGILHSISKLSLDVYQKELADLRQNIVDRVVTSSQNELFPFYQKLWSCALTWLSLANSNDRNGDTEVLKIEQVFTNITIKDDKDAYVAITDLFSYFTSDGLLPRLLIVEGIAGIGKSHLCKYILHKWASKEGGDISLNGIDIIIFIQCYAINSYSLREFLTEELLQTTCRTLKHEDVIPAFRMCHLMFIIDGIDEAGSKAKGIIKEVSTKFPDSRILITCRPEFTEEAKRLVSQNENFYTFYAKGFDENQRRAYLDKLLNAIKYNATDDCKIPNELHYKIQELEHHLYSLLCLPLTIMMLVLLWLEDSNSLSHTTTVTRIHQLTTDTRIKHLALRIQRKPGEVRHISLIKRMCKNWLHALSKVAWETLMKNTQILDENCISELVEEAEAYNIDPIDALSTFLKCTVWEKMSGSEYNWEFFHKTFQEYLSAMFLSCNPKEFSGQTFVPDMHVRTKQVIVKSTGRQTKTNCDCLFILCHCFQRLFSRTNLTEDMLQQSNVSSDRPVVLYYDSVIGADPQLEGVGAPPQNPFKLCSDMSGIRNHHISFHGHNIKKSAIKKSRRRKKRVYENFVPEERGAKADWDDLMPGWVQSYFDSSKKEVSTDEEIMEQSQLQNTLQFLAAMEASKEDVNYEYMEGIMKKFNETMSTNPWLPWATFLRECGEHPSVCELLSDILVRINSAIYILEPGINENLEAIGYLLEKTKYKPIVMRLWFTKSFPEALSSVLCMMTKVSPIN